MNEALATWLEKLDKKILPVLEHSQRELTGLLRDDNVQMNRLAIIIERDMGLGLHLLRFINSLSSRHLKSDLNTVNHALMMLGLNQLKRLPVSLTAIDSLKPNVQSLLRSFYTEAHHAAYQAGQWALLRKDFEPDEIYIAALLHNLGEVLLWLFNTADMTRLRDMLKQGDMEKEQAEYVVLGFGIKEMTKELAKSWHLPELFRDSLYPENANKPRVRPIILASQLARHARKSWYSEDMAEIIEEIAEYLYLDVNSTTALVHGYAAEAARDTPYIGSRPAILNLISAPVASKEETEQKAAATVAETKAVVSETGKQAAEIKPTPIKEQVVHSNFCLITQPAIVEKALKYLASNAGQLSVKDVISTTMNAMHDGIGLNRVVFTLLTQHKNHLRPRSIVGVDNDPVFTEFSIPLANNTLFARLMDKPQSIWLDDQNRSKFWPAISVEFQRLIKVNRFLAMSVFVKGKPIGMFYADRASNDCELDESSYKMFKQLVTQASISLANTAG